MKDKRKTVVINSSGSMGMSVVGAMVEKFGYLNIPVRKLGLHDYLIKSRKVDDGYFQSKMNILFDNFSTEKCNVGGISIQDRDNSKGRKYIDKKKIEDRIKYMNSFNFDTIYDLYQFSRNSFAESLIYKASNHNLNKHIEYANDIHKYNSIELCEAYQREFGEVKMINLHREFVSWIDSQVSQKMNHKILRKRYYFVLHSAFTQFNNYEKAISKFPGLTLHFEELFIPGTNNVFKKISDYLGEDIPDLNGEYDLFGKVMSYDRAFTQVDMVGKNLSKTSIWFLNYVIKKGRVSIFDSALFYPLYLIDGIRYRRSGRSF
jgi:hypothetical protein